MHHETWRKRSSDTVRYLSVVWLHLMYNVFIIKLIVIFPYENQTNCFSNKNACFIISKTSYNLYSTLLDSLCNIAVNACNVNKLFLA